MSKISLINFLKNLGEINKDVDFYEPHLSSKIIKFYNLSVEFYKRNKLKEIIYPKIFEFKSQSGFRGRVLVITYDKSKIGNEFFELVKEFNFNIIEQEKNKKEIIIII